MNLPLTYNFSTDFMRWYPCEWTAGHIFEFTFLAKFKLFTVPMGWFRG